MTTLRIELPPKLNQQLQHRGISNQQLTTIITKLLELYLNSDTLQQALSLVGEIFRPAKTTTNEDTKIEQMAPPDPIFQLGTQPILDDVTDASINHDRYLYS